MNKKLEQLEKIILNKKKLAIALSGGLDSIVLLAFTAKVLGKENVLALSAKMPYSFDKELNFAKEFTKKNNIKFCLININTPKEILTNPSEKCYFCKKNIFSTLISSAKENGFDFLADGTNYSDLNEYRAGFKAAKEEKIFSPFLESLFTKEDIKTLGKSLNIDDIFIENPPNTCVLTRIKTNKCFDNTLIEKIKKTEEILENNNFSAHRARALDKNTLKIELDKKQLNSKNFDVILKILPQIKSLNWANISLDLLPYKRGSMNNNNNNKTPL